MQSIWESRQFHRTPDLVVVGAGIVGLFTALFYKRRNPGHHVLVVERGAFPSGASVKNAGFACFGSPSELLADLDQEGADRMLARVENRWKGLLELRAELGDKSIGFEPSGGHEIYKVDELQYTQVCERFDDLNASLRPIFGKAAFRWDDEGVVRFGLGAGHRMVRTDLEGPLDAGMLMGTLLRKALAEGVFFRPRTTVARITEEQDQVLLDLADGDRIQTSQIAVCTNGYARELLPDIAVVPARGQVLKTTPIDGLKLKGTFHYKQGYYYFRDHAGGVLLGGGRDLDKAAEETMTEATTDLVQSALEQMLREVILPGRSFAIAQRWSGIMGMGPSKTPIVERRGPRVVVAVRLGGMGVAIGIRVAREAAALLDRG